jgi:hypothetical protein
MQISQMPKDKSLQKEIIDEVAEEKNKWTDQKVHVTENVAFRPRDLIRTLRKNYWGIYDEPKDPTTGREKIWVPLTEQIVETGVAQTNFDPKDMRFEAKTKKARPTTEVIRAIVTDYTDRTYFGQDLNTSNRQLHIDGTIVWKTRENDFGDPERHNVDLLNFFIDPTADSIQDAYRVTERILMTPEELNAQDDWINTDDVETKENLQKTQTKSRQNNEKSNVELVDVYEMWGLVPEYFITGNSDDTDQIEAQIVVSGLETGDPTFHFAQENTKEDAAGNIIKPYEECWETKVQNRWYGRGMAEKVMMLQLWLNTTVNIRINRFFLTQMGLFKIRKGSGITPDKLQNLPQNGGVVVNSMDDIENFAMQDVSAAAFNEEQSITQWAQKVSSAFDHVAGAQLPAETPATNASISQENANATFKLVNQNIGNFLQRWVDRHALPILARNTDADDVIRLTGNDARTKKLFDRVVAYRAEKALDDFQKEVMQTRFRQPEEVDNVIQKAEQMNDEIQRVREKFLEENDVFIETLEDLMTDDVQTRIYFTNQQKNTDKIVSNLLNTLQVAPELKKEIVPELFDLMDMDMPQGRQNVSTDRQADQKQISQDKPGNRAARQQVAQAPSRSRNPRQPDQPQNAR